MHVILIFLIDPFYPLDEGSVVLCLPPMTRSTDYSTYEGTSICIAKNYPGDVYKYLCHQELSW